MQLFGKEQFKHQNNTRKKNHLIRSVRSLDQQFIASPTVTSQIFKLHLNLQQNESPYFVLEWTLISVCPTVTDNEFEFLIVNSHMHRDGKGSQKTPAVYERNWRK